MRSPGNDWETGFAATSIHSVGPISVNHDVPPHQRPLPADLMVVTGRYRVVSELSLHGFDEPLVGRALAVDAFDELQRLTQSDLRLRRTRMRRTGPLIVQVTSTVTAASADDAAHIFAASLRSAIHAAGGRTAHWSVPPVEMAQEQRRGRRRERRDHSPVRQLPECGASDDWATSSASAQATLARLPALPPLAGPPTDELVDLRQRAG